MPDIEHTCRPLWNWFLTFQQYFHQRFSYNFFAALKDYNQIIYLYSNAGIFFVKRGNFRAHKLRKIPRFNNYVLFSGGLKIWIAHRRNDKLPDGGVCKAAALLWLILEHATGVLPYIRYIWMKNRGKKYFLLMICHLSYGFT